MQELTGIAAQIEDVIGHELTMHLLRMRGGTEITIPVRAAGSMLAGIIGEAEAAALSNTIGAGKIVLPMAQARGVGGRRARAMRMLQKGASVAQVALACDLHVRTVANYRAAMDDDAGSDQMDLPFDAQP